LKKIENKNSIDKTRKPSKKGGKFVLLFLVAAVVKINSDRKSISN